MCGISGFVFSDRSGRQADEATVVRMRDVLHHRGPDGAGAFVEGPVGLGHRRLSIIDVACGHQPMTNEDGSLQIVFNGEIYNHREVRPGLEARGHVYTTHADTETILHAYEEYGADCVAHLRGMFAFAIWNRNTRELFIARDRLGVKPVYYVHADDGSLYFASEIKALLAAGAVRASLNVDALPDYLANHGTSDDTTLFRGVRRLPQGHTLTWRDGRIHVACYWDALPVAEQPAAMARSDRDYTAEWSDLFRTSVRLRLMSDVPLGMFLSGGIDSSAIAAVMSRMVNDPIKTFSVGFADREANEFMYARMVASAFRTDHHEIELSPGDFFAALPHLIWHEDEPLGHSASVPLYFVSQLAQRYVKVVLTGEGSDELLAGYNRYRMTVFNLAAAEPYHRFSTDGLRRAVRSLAGGLAPHRMRRRLARTFLWLAPDVTSLYFDNFAVFSRTAQESLLAADLRGRLERLDPYAGMRRFFEAPGTANLLDRLLYTDLKTYLHELLMKQDQMSMAASIESRVPFLDHVLVEYSMRLPARMKLRGWTTKHVLREAMKGILPDAIMTRRKMGFPVPLARWFRGPYRHLLDEYVLGPRVQARGLFAPDALQRLVHEHVSGAADHADRLWALINVEMWQRQFIDLEPRTGALPELPEVTRASHLAA